MKDTGLLFVSLIWSLSESSLLMPLGSLIADVVADILNPLLSWTNLPAGNPHYKTLGLGFLIVYFLALGILPPMGVSHTLPVSRILVLMIVM